MDITLGIYQRIGVVSGFEAVFDIVNLFRPPTPTPAGLAARLRQACGNPTSRPKLDCSAK
jgi:hypothetical protein